MFTKYEIVRERQRAPMERRIAEWISKGYQPIGGLQVVIDEKVDANYRETFYQAMGLVGTADPQRTDDDNFTELFRIFIRRFGPLTSTEQHQLRHLIVGIQERIEHEQ